MTHDHPTFKMSKEFWIQKIKKSRCCPFYSLLCELCLDDCWRQPRNLAEKEEISYNKQFYASLLNDREIIEAIIQKDGTSIVRLNTENNFNRMLKYTENGDDWILKDRDLVLMAVKSDIKESSYIAENMNVLLQHDPDFMLELVAVNGALINFAGWPIRRSKDFVKKAMHLAGKDIFNRLSEKDILALLE